MTDALLDSLADDLAPVRPRSSARDLGVLLLLAGIEAALLFALGLARPGLGYAMPAMLGWKLAAPAVLALAASATALRALDPARRTVGTAALGGLALAALVVGVFLAQGTQMGTLDPASGVGCALTAAALALPPALALGLLLRRGAPAHPCRTGLAAAIAGGAWGAALLGLHCPNDGAMHALVWHTLAVAIPALAAALPLARAARW